MQTSERKLIPCDDLILPEIARPCSVSLDERFVVNKEKRRTKKRPPCLHLVRLIRHFHLYTFLVTCDNQ